MRAWIRLQAERLGVILDDVALDRLSVYQQLLAEWNERINLTSITQPDSVYELHFLDSLSVQLVADLRTVNNLVDVGTGAGFPGVVLAIAFPGLRVTLMDSTEKKIDFLSLLCRELGLSSRVGTISLRAEQAGQTSGLRENYQVTVARGVARLSVLAEYCLPLTKPGGIFVAMKGPSLASELVEASRSLTVLGGGEPKLLEWNLPSGAGRTLLAVPKLRGTPAGYPRRVGLPGKRPLH